MRDFLTSVCWTRDGRGFFYIRRAPPKAGEPADSLRLEKQLLYHFLGKPQSRDRLIHEWKDARWVYCMQSEDGRYAIAGAEMGTENEVYIADLGDPMRPDVAAPWTRLLGCQKAFHTPIDVVGRTLYLRTDLEASHKRVIALDLDQGAGARPRTIVPESPEVIVDAVVAGDRLVVHYLEDVKSRLRLFALDGQAAGEVALPGIVAVGWPLTGRPSAPELFYG